jgi:glycosyltransferase involved in cell wall biosynthesis
MQAYERLPAVLGGFDVALMPFALNEATRSISPTKTLEYLAAGLPVVSTHVPDVVSSFGEVVELQDDGAGFAAACRTIVGHSVEDRDRALAPLLHERRWDTIAARMQRLMDRSERELLQEQLAPAIPNAAQAVESAMAERNAS